ncbi:hypothetical protein [Oceanithermus sp.]
MRLAVRHQHQAEEGGPYHLLLPGDRPGQRVDAAALSRSPDERLSEPDLSLACFRLARGEGIELRFEAETASTFTREAPPAGQELARVVEEAAAALHERGWPYDAASGAPGAPSLLLALAVSEALTRTGRPAGVVLGHVLREGVRPHAWVRLEQEGLELDPWFYLQTREHPALWLGWGLAPAPEDYLGGHEGHRIAWGRAPMPADRLPCQDMETRAESLLFFWPDLNHPLSSLAQPDGRSRLHVTPTGALARLRELTALSRAVTFLALLLVALGFITPGGWTWVAYLTYATLLAGLQGPALVKLAERPQARRHALEALLFHAALIAIFAGADTVLPQTLYVLTWIYNRLEPFLRRAGQRSRAD